MSCSSFSDVMFSCFVNINIMFFSLRFAQCQFLSGAVLAETSTQVLTPIQCCSQSRVNLDSVAVTRHG